MISTENISGDTDLGQLSSRSASRPVSMPFHPKAMWVFVRAFSPGLALSSLVASWWWANHRLPADGGDANSGGFLSRELKAAGYDAVFFTGAAEKPVWVLITESGIEIKDAGFLWGKDAVETEEVIRETLGDKKVQVACIGQSGERLSRISGVVHDGGRIAARSGLGAVMGSKKLKAVARARKKESACS